MISSVASAFTHPFLPSIFYPLCSLRFVSRLVLPGEVSRGRKRALLQKLLERSMVWMEIRRGGLRVWVYTTRSGHDHSTHIIPSRRFGFLFTVLILFFWAVDFSVTRNFSSLFLSRSRVSGFSPPFDFLCNIIFTFTFFLTMARYPTFDPMPRL